MPIQIIELIPGYVEDSLVSRLILTSRYPFETKELAVESLTKYFLKTYLEKLKIFPISECCKLRKKLENYCCICGKRTKDFEFEHIQFADWIYWTCQQNVDSYPMIDIDEWNPFVDVSELLNCPNLWFTFDDYPERKMAIIAKNIISKENGKIERIKISDILNNFWEFNDF